MNIIKPDFLKNIWGHDCHGVLGMVCAPGRKKSQANPPVARDLLTDIQNLKNHYNTSTILSLLEDHQYKQMNTELEPDYCQRYQIKFLKYPIRDRDIPRNMISYRQMIRNIVDEQIRNQQRTVVIHCAAGLGRTGIVAGSCLKYIGYNTQNAIRSVRNVRAGTIQIKEQQQFLENLTF